MRLNEKEETQETKFDKVFMVFTWGYQTDVKREKHGKRYRKRGKAGMHPGAISRDKLMQRDAITLFNAFVNRATVADVKKC